MARLAGATLRVALLAMGSLLAIGSLLAFGSRPAFGSRDEALGPGDQIVVRATHVAEISDKPVRIDGSGYVRLPMIGRVRATGRSADEVAEEIRVRLGDLVQEPEVSVEIVERKSQAVSVLGSVKAPGVYQLQGSRRLLDMLSAAGGLSDDASSGLRVTRAAASGPIPAKGAHQDETGRYSVAEIAVPELMEASNPAANVEILPGDVITVPRAKLIYVIGEVRKPGGFVLRDQEAMSVIQALALAEGTTMTAGASEAKVLRPVDGSGVRQEIAVNVKDILAGKRADFQLAPEDVLFIPGSRARSAGLRALEAAIQVGTGVAIWRR